MKKGIIFAVLLVMTVSLSACGRGNSNATSAPTIKPTTDMTILPDTMPTIGTNIPDPDVDTSMPMYTDGTGGTDSTGASGTNSRRR